MELTEEEQREGERWLEEQALGGEEHDKDTDVNAQLQNLNLKDETPSNIHVLNEEEEEAYDQFLKQMGGPEAEVEGGMNDEEAEAYEQFLEAQERAKQARGPCRFFLQGKCLKGENCSFSHSQAHMDDGRGGSRGGRGGGYYHNSYYNPNYNNYNYNYNQGYREYEGNYPPQSSTYYPPSDQGNTKEIQCKFFLSGNCRYGNGCRFKH